MNPDSGAAERRAAEKRIVRALDWIILGFCLGMASLGAVALIVIEGGLFDATATKPHLPIVAWAVHTAFIHSVYARAPKRIPPIPAGPAPVREGLALYDSHCAVCHGAPGQSRDLWVRGLNPTPPYLLDAADRWTAGQLRWIIARGVKMTAMPAWRGSLSPAQIDEVIAFLRALPYLTADQYAAIKTAAGPASADPNAPGPPASPGPVTSGAPSAGEQP